MDTLQLLFLALMQGITEFLPISSSAHLILPSQVLGWPDQGLAFDVAVHLGTLAAILTYFRNDLTAIIQDWTLNVVGKAPKSLRSRQGWMLIWATIPAVAFGGFAAMTGLDDTMRSATVIAATTLIFGALLGFADYTGKRTESLRELTMKQAILIGLAQALAIIPGTSRSGITITAGLMLGLTREAASRFSFLLSIPIIIAATALILFELITSNVAVEWSVLLGGTMVAGLSAYYCIHYFLAFINRIGMVPFVIYRLALGCTLLFVIYG